MDMMKDAATLHALATHPERILKPGKSLRSALITQNGAIIETLDGKRLETKALYMLQKAYWDKVRLLTRLKIVFVSADELEMQ